MKIESTLELLSNFSFNNDADCLFYRIPEKNLETQELYKGLKALRLKCSPNSLESTCLDFLEETAELENLVIALDLKLSTFAKHIGEPYQGYFDLLGISPKHGLIRPKESKKHHLRLVEKPVKP